MNGRGIITKIFDWFGHAGYSQASVGEWLAGLMLLLILSFLWSTVVKQTVD